MEGERAAVPCGDFKEESKTTLYHATTRYPIYLTALAHSRIRDRQAPMHTTLFSAQVSFYVSTTPTLISYLPRTGPVDPHASFAAPAITTIPRIPHVPHTHFPYLYPIVPRTPLVDLPILTPSIILARCAALFFSYLIQRYCLPYSV